MLIVEDDAATRDMLRKTLEKEGWEVAEAENGRVGLEEVARGDRPDSARPDDAGDGRLRIRDELRQRRAAALPVVVLTAKDLTEEDRRRLTGSVELILQKGAASREKILAEIRSLVGRCRDRLRAQGD